jgi:hypothetical protein
VGAKAFMRAAKSGTTFIIYATPIIESVKGLEALPTHYKEYQDVFEKKNVNLFLQHLAQLIFKKILNHCLDQSIIYLKMSLLPSNNTLMKILPRTSFDILSFKQAHLSFL